MVSFYSTKNPSQRYSLEYAVMHGLAPDGGLFMPAAIPQLPKSFFDELPNLSLPEIALEVSCCLLQDQMPKKDLKNIIEAGVIFDAPLVKLAERLHVLELFHGPTLSFKDFGAHFMSALLSYFNRHEKRTLNILVATSGDTGSAVAHGFFDVPGIKVWILYPKGQVSSIQEKQLTTVGRNVCALQVEGSFDDCQALVKQAFNDEQLARQVRLTSANSINIARLIPQSFYYFAAYAQLGRPVLPVVVSVPSGNFGNLTAGLLAKRMGLPIERFLAATNRNDSVPKYLQTGEFKPHPSVQTLSNAMDVGNPSNFARMLDLYQHDVIRMRQEIFGVRFTDEETKGAIREIYRNYGYIADPHGAVAYLGLCQYRQKAPDCEGIFLETAHPAKFLDLVEPILQTTVEVPERLQKVLDKESLALPLPNSYDSLKDTLLKES